MFPAIAEPVLLFGGGRAVGGRELVICLKESIRPEPNISRDKGDSLNGLHAELSDSPKRTLSKLLTDYGLGLTR